MKEYLFVVIVQLDILLMALFFRGKRNETMSAAAWSLHQSGKFFGIVFVPMIDFIFSWYEKDHCALAYLTERT